MADFVGLLFILVLAYAVIGFVVGSLMWLGDFIRYKKIGISDPKFPPNSWSTYKFSVVLGVFAWPLLVFQQKTGN